jgi:hypothetical protein
LLRPGSLDPGYNEDLRVPWLAAVHECVRVAGGGLIGEVLKPSAGRNYYAVSVQFHRGVPGVVMLNPAVRVVALAALGVRDDPSLAQQRTFLDMPAARVFQKSGFIVPSAFDLERDLTSADVADLSRGELEDIAYHQPRRVGDVVFNWFD